MFHSQFPHLTQIQFECFRIDTGSTKDISKTDTIQTGGNSKTVTTSSNAESVNTVSNTASTNNINAGLPEILLSTSSITLTTLPPMICELSAVVIDCVLNDCSTVNGCLVLVVTVVTVFDV
jgi:hypothetical protein